MLCIGIWLVGLVVNMIVLMPPFFLPSLLGGFLWTTGETLVAEEAFISAVCDLLCVSNYENLFFLSFNFDHWFLFENWFYNTVRHVVRFTLAQISSDVCLEGVVCLCLCNHSIHGNLLIFPCMQEI